MSKIFVRLSVQSNDTCQQLIGIYPELWRHTPTGEQRKKEIALVQAWFIRVGRLQCKGTPQVIP